VFFDQLGDILVEFIHLRSIRSGISDIAVRFCRRVDRTMKVLDRRDALSKWFNCIW
jgi:hypothetical protein